MRLQVQKVGQVTVLNDAYNANPASMMAALWTLVDLPTSGRRVAVLGDMRELGESSDRLHREMGQHVAIIRPKTFIGTGRLGVFQILFDWVHNGNRIPIIGSGNNRYQLLEVEDLVDAVILALTAPAEAANETFNVGAKRFDTVKRDVQALCDFAGNGARVLPTPGGLVKGALRVFEMLKLSPLYAWVYATADKDSFVSTEKIEQALGWQPRYSNAEALIRSYKWYLEHFREVEGSSGVTHRVAWNQGILRVFRRLLSW
jgi:hypothetical protein